MPQSYNCCTRHNRQGNSKCTWPFSTRPRAVLRTITATTMNYRRVRPISKIGPPWIIERSRYQSLRLMPMNKFSPMIDMRTCKWRARVWRKQRATMQLQWRDGINLPSWSFGLLNAHTISIWTWVPTTPWISFNQWLMSKRPRASLSILREESLWNGREIFLTRAHLKWLGSLTGCVTLRWLSNSSIRSWWITDTARELCRNWGQWSVCLVGTGCKNRYRPSWGNVHQTSRATLWRASLILLVNMPSYVARSCSPVTLSYVRLLFRGLGTGLTLLLASVTRITPAINHHQITLPNC